MKRSVKMNLQLFAGMNNPDLNTEVELKDQLKNAIESGDSEEFARVQVEMAKGIEARILREAKSAMNEDINDNAIMVKRGLNPLTKEEKAYYNEVIGTEGFAGTEKLMPATIFDRVFEDLRQNHPLLAEIDFVNTTATTEWITRNSDCEAAWWGALTDEITKKLSASFKKEQTGLYKLSAFVPVAKAMLDLGPQWLDRFVREILAESIAIALEEAIVVGDGNGKPVGMTKDLDTVTLGVHADKAPVALTKLTPATFGSKIMAPLTDNGKRNIGEVMFVVNPLDYWEKIFPATTFQSATGQYVSGILPYPAKIIQSVAMPQGKMVAGLAKNYFMGIGSTQKIEFSDHYKFLEDERTNLVKQYANGKPMDNDSFIVFNIANLEITIPQVSVVGTVSTKEEV